MAARMCPCGTCRISMKPNNYYNEAFIFYFHSITYVCYNHVGRRKAHNP